MNMNKQNYSKFNKGEWSEPYVFLKLLFDKKLDLADSNLNKLKNNYLVIQSIIRDNNCYIVDFNKRCVCIRSDDPTSNSLFVPSYLFFKYSEILVNDLKNSNRKNTFQERLVEDFLLKIGIKHIKTKSSLKGDINLKIHDVYTNTDPIVSFSIKSLLAGRPTLLNASRGTIINFKLSGKLNKKTIQKINLTHKIKDKLELIDKSNFILSFNKFINKTFEFNLKMIDTEMPKILAKLYYYSYFVPGKRIPEVVDYYCVAEKEDKKLITYKVKSLLINVALGMMPETEWDGLDEANGGYIVVKSTGEIVGYNIYDRNLLKEYLFQSTNFDSPSLKRLNCGKVFNSSEFNLALMIRFGK